MANTVPVIEVASTALVTSSILPLQSGQLASVWSGSVASVWVLDLSSVAPLGSGVLATQSGVGRWLLLGSRSGMGGPGGFRYFDDFLSTLLSGCLGWSQGSNGAGSGVFAQSTLADATHPGVIECRTGAGAGGRGVQFLSSTTVANPGASGTLSFESLVRLSALSTLVDDYFLNIGWNDNPNSGGNGTNGIMFRYDGPVAANWFAVVRAGGIETANVDTGVAVVAGGWVKLGIVVDPVEAKFSVNGVLAATVPQASLPVAQRMGATIKIQKQSGVASIILATDYAKLDLDLVVTR